jgi:hypothetical protein
MVTNCKTTPTLQRIKDPARFSWHEVVQVDHYYLSVEEIVRNEGGRA